MAHLRPIRMLIVEDSEDDAFLLGAELTSRGLPVDWRRVDQPAAMASELAADDWDVIICDHNMPGFDSLDALRVLKESGKDVPFIIYSGQISDQQALSAMHEGVHDYIEKGNIARLLPVIERELRNAAARHAVRQADSRIRELAYFDGLSNLPNQNLFCARITEWLLEAEQRGTALAGALYYIDIDRFLRINSSFGYETGNDILRQVARRLREGVPPQATIARLSGDAFGIFVPGILQREGVEEIAHAIKRTFEAPFVKDAVELFITLSVGIARLPADGSESHELLMNAETAMAYAKRRGGNGAEFYRRDMNAGSGERVALEADLRHAIERNELFLQYQPCIEAANGRMVGVEALVRWHHPEQGVLMPNRFIPIADETGIIVDLGQWVLRRACAQGAQWCKRAPDFYVAVNVSAVQFAQPRLLETVAQALAESGLPAGNLQLEITESVLMSDVESAGGMLRALKNMGVRVSVDDFGTGYSSLSYLKRLPIDILKIDQSFVRDLPADEDDAAIVRAIVALARALRLTTVAEGVETREQAALLSEERCDRFQGYFFSHPMDAEAIDARLAAEGV